MICLRKLMIRYRLNKGMNNKKNVYTDFDKDDDDDEKEEY